jgi:heat shock protein HtpX
MIVMVFEIAFSFLGMFVIAYFSRTREFRADKGGANYAGRQKMIAALRRLKTKFEMVDPNTPENFASMKISSKKGLMNFLSTHPSLDDRIAALERA